MTTIERRTRPLVGLAAVAVLLSACADDNDRGVGDHHTTHHVIGPHHDHPWDRARHAGDRPCRGDAGDGRVPGRRHGRSRRLRQLARHVRLLHRSCGRRDGPALHRRQPARRSRRRHRARGAGLRARRQRRDRRTSSPTSTSCRSTHGPRPRRPSCSGSTSTSTRRFPCGSCTPGCGRTTRPASSRTGTQPCGPAHPASRSSARTSELTTVLLRSPLNRRVRSAVR